MWSFLTPCPTRRSTVFLCLIFLIVFAERRNDVDWSSVVADEHVRPAHLRLQAAGLKPESDDSADREHRSYSEAADTAVVAAESSQACQFQYGDSGDAQLGAEQRNFDATAKALAAGGWKFARHLGGR